MGTQLAIHRVKMPVSSQFSDHSTYCTVSIIAKEEDAARVDGIGKTPHSHETQVTLFFDVKHREYAQRLHRAIRDAVDVPSVAEGETA